MSSSTGNCAEDFDDLLAQLDEAKAKTSNVPAMVAPPKAAPNLNIGTVDYLENEVTKNLLKDNPIAYIAGYFRNVLNITSVRHVEKLWSQINLATTGTCFVSSRHTNQRK